MKAVNDVVKAGWHRAMGVLLVAVLAVVGALGWGVPVTAAYQDPACAGLTEVQKEAAGCNTSSNRLVPDVVKDLVNVVVAVVGILAVFMIVVGGIMFAISAGDPGKITAARNTVIFSAVGLLIAVLAWAIVNFVLGAI